MTQIGDYIGRPGGGMPGGFGSAPWRRLFALPQRPALFSPFTSARSVSFGSSSQPAETPATALPTVPSLSKRAPQANPAECVGRA